MNNLGALSDIVILWLRLDGLIGCWIYWKTENRWAQKNP